MFGYAVLLVLGEGEVCLFSCSLGWGGVQRKRWESVEWKYFEFWESFWGGCWRRLRSFDELIIVVMI